MQLINHPSSLCPALYPLTSPPCPSQPSLPHFQLTTTIPSAKSQTRAPAPLQLTMKPAVSKSPPQSPSLLHHHKPRTLHYASSTSTCKHKIPRTFNSPCPSNHHKHPSKPP
ncbi:hypothetical protein M0R45_016520 [Rubus argutus]|uniref:Uncharacterized protein n=1 Tax=Rubus argutus TaxID=59490 RepID=A0AAW1XU68_RUBAR